MKLNMILKT